MVVKLKKGMKILGTCLWLLAGVFLCGKIEVYGVEGRLTEEEVKRQVVEIVEENREGEVTRSTVVEYDIEDLYQIIHMDLIINDYIEGRTFGELIKKKQMENTDFTYWILPYTNINQEKCYMFFNEQNRKMQISFKTWNLGNNFNMKIKGDKYLGIEVNDIEREFYIELDLYEFKIIYIILKNGKEYIVPYFQNEVNNWVRLKHEKVYTINDFMVEMYNCYNEPTKSELIEWGRRNSMGDLSKLIRRKKRLDYNNIQEIRGAEKVKRNGIWLFFTIVTVAIFGVTIYKKKKQMN